MSKIHVLPDENLGGGPNGQILREYVEVNRRAKAGDKIVIVRPDEGSAYEKGDIFTVEKSYKNHPEFEDGVKVEEDFYFIYHSEYHTLEPTDVVVIDNQRYRLVDRKAKVGERIIIVDGKGWYRDKIGNIYEVIHSSKYGFEEDDDGRAYVEHEHNEYNEAIHYVRRGNYRVLEPVEPAEEGDDVLTVDETEASKSVLDLLANLAHRLTTLEQQVTRRVTELEQKLNFVKSDVNMVIDDIVTLDERTQPLVALAKAVKADE
jgi:hypothetical protein